MLIYRWRVSTFSADQVPSQGMVPLRTRSRMASAWARTSSQDHRSKAKRNEGPVPGAEERLDVLLVADRLVGGRQAGVVGISGGLVDPGLPAELGVHRLHRQAVAHGAAVAAVLAHGLVDDEANRRGGQDATLAQPAGVAAVARAAAVVRCRRRCTAAGRVPLLCDASHTSGRKITCVSRVESYVLNFGESGFDRSLGSRGD